MDMLYDVAAGSGMWAYLEVVFVSDYFHSDIFEGCPKLCKWSVVP